MSGTDQGTRAGSASTVSALFTPFTLRRTTLANRIVMAPMTREHSPNGVPGLDVAAYYARRAAGGCGLIITEGTLVNHPAAGRSTQVPRFYGDDALQGWARVVERVHARGGLIMPQLWHVGSDRLPGEGFYPDAVSIGPVPTPDVRGMSAADMEDVVIAFADAAADARALGFDGIELHGGHGYLLDQFLWAVANRRTDGLGGTAASRATFPARVVAACRTALGPDLPIVFRISHWKVSDFDARIANTPQELQELLQPLAAAGVDAFHCSTRRFWQPEFPDSALNLAGWVKKLLHLPVITVGSVGLDGDFLDAIVHGKGAPVSGLERISAMVASEEVDLVAVGRVLLQDAFWPDKVACGRFSEVEEFSAASLKKLV